MSIKPGKRDIKCNFLIQREELLALQNITYLMSECFGLDSRIMNYKGTRPIGLYQWDFECLIAAIEYAIDDKRGTSTVTQQDQAALAQLFERMNEVYQQTYGKK